MEGGRNRKTVPADLKDWNESLQLRSLSGKVFNSSKFVAQDVSAKLWQGTTDLQTFFKSALENPVSKDYLNFEQHQKYSKEKLIFFFFY